MKNLLITACTFCLLYIYNLYMIGYFIKLLNTKYSKNILLIILPTVISMFSTILITQEILIPILYLMLLIFTIIVFVISFDEPKSVIYILCINIIFHLIITRDIFVGVISIIVGNTMYQIVESNKLYMLSFSLSKIITIVIILNFKKICNLEITKKLLIDKSNLVFMMLVKTALMILILISNFIFYYGDNTKLITTINLANYIAVCICFIFTLVMENKFVSCKESELNNKLISMQLEHQQDLYKKRDQMEELIKIYNHDFKNILNNAGLYLEKGKIDEAKQLLLSANSEIKSIINGNKKYSNNIIVDIILNSLSEKCKKNKIEFKGECYIPKELSLSDLDLSRIFSNLSDNAFEAVNTLRKEEIRKIIFKSYIKDNMFIIYEENTFCGQVKIKNNRLLTTKKNCKCHGLGVKSIEQIIKNVNGLVIFKIEKETNEFKFLIKVPIKI